MTDRAGVISFELIAVLAIACGATIPGSPRSDRGTAGERGAFVVATDEGLLRFDEACRPTGPFIGLPSEARPGPPALTADRRALLFDVQDTPGRSEVYRVELDGSGSRVIFAHAADGVRYDSPQLDPSGDVLYLHRGTGRLVDGRMVDVGDAIERVDLRTDERRTIVRDVRDFTLAPDGRSLMYVPLRNFARLAELWIVAADGSEARPFHRPGGGYLGSPRYSPSGADVAFSSSQLVRAQHNLFTFSAAVLVAAADGSSVRAIGKPRELSVESIIPAWSPDGTRIAYVVGNELTILTVADGSRRTCTDERLGGAPVWVR